MPKGTELISAKYHASQIAEAMNAAYWMETYGHQEVVDMKLNDARDDLIKLCNLFGIEARATSSEAAA